MSYAGVQMFMDKLKQLINCNDIPSINNRTIKRKSPQFKLLYEELGSMIQALQHHDLVKVNDLKKRFTDAAQEAEYMVDLFLSAVHIRNNGDVRRLFKFAVVQLVSYLHIGNNKHFTTSLNLDDVWRSFNLVKVELTSLNIRSLKTDSSRIPETTLNQSSAAAPVSFTRNSQGSTKLLDEIVVGLEHDVELIRDKLVEDQKKLVVVSIVGMGGIGKTTLATKIFHDSYVKHHFYVRAWVTVSQTYNKRDVLIQILESIRGQLHLEKENNESHLREMVHKNLMGKRYFIVIDDIWHTETWDNLKLFLPRNNTGSRLLLTTRLTEVAKRANSNGLIHHIAYLNKETSLELLRQKVFRRNTYPKWSIKPGMQIVEDCKGLPLAVAVIAGVLAKQAWSEKFWGEIAYRAGSSYIVDDQTGCLETLALSYNHLSLHLRECFLYLGGFPEDYKFQVKRLIWLWVAEGFIEEDGNRSLEDIAEGYLMDLIDRNLVIVTDRKSNGVVKACKMHDLVRELCLKKAKEERFFNHFSNDITTPPYKPARMFINEDLNFPYPSVKHLRAILCFSRLSDEIASCFHSFVLLRVLDLQKCELNGFPRGMELLVHLRYLAMWNSSEYFPSSKCNLWNLQTLIYTAHYGSGDVTLPNNISNLVNLRHLWSYRGSVVFLPSIERPMKLQTILGVRLGDGVHNLQNWFPCIKELQFNADSEKYYDFKSLIYLEKLKLVGCVRNHITFPTTLKTLTLARCGLPWSDMSIIQSLPNLEVLKLHYKAFEGSCWNTDEQEFPRLQFLRLRDLDIKRWEVYSTSFPCLRQLEISRCDDLEETPLEIGEIPTLELIKIDHSRPSVGESVRRIQEEQHDFGNYDINIDISAELPLKKD